MSITDVYKEIKTNLLATRKDLVLNPGSAINDIFLGPTAFVIDQNRVLLNYVKMLQTFEDILALLGNSDTIQEIADVENKTSQQVENDISDFIDKKAADFGIVRRTQVSATGYAYFGRFDAPTFDITVPANTQIRTLDNKVYQTDSNITIYVAQAGSYYDSEENLYLLRVPITAVVSGTVGNTATYTINTIINQVSGIEYVLNKDALANGVDEETDEELIARIKSVISANNWATKAGIATLITDNFPTVKDVLVQTTGDPLMIRDSEYCGMTDVYVLEETAAVPYTDTINVWNVKYSGVYSGSYLTKQPVDSVVTAVNFAKDITTVLAYSNFAKSLVYYNNPPPSLPQTVDYFYFTICEDINAFLMDDSRRLIGTNDGTSNPENVSIMIKKAIDRLAEIQFSLVILTGYVQTTVESNIITAINDYINNLMLGDRLSQSDIVGIVEGVEGVDYIDFTGGIFDLDGGTGLNVTLTIAVNEYIRLGTLTIM